MIRIERQGVVRVAASLAVLNAETGKELVALVRGDLGTGRPAVVVDLRATPLMDSAGLEALLELRDSVDKGGGAVKLAGVNPLCRDILKATGLSELLPQFVSVKSAVGSFLS